ncbi:MAG: hypothetical protein GY874_08135 [Desulfobacteraceae bacterium]|nr:hypothetical protein [Desulfobacteraceae bacterium]
MKKNIQISPFNFSYGLEDIKFQDHADVLHLPEKGYSPVAFESNRSHLNRLFENISMDSFVMQLLSPIVKDASTLCPVRFNDLLGKTQKKLKKNIKSSQKGDKSVNLKKRALAVLDDNAELVYLFNKYRHSLHLV